MQEMCIHTFFKIFAVRNQTTHECYNVAMLVNMMKMDIKEELILHLQPMYLKVLKNSHLGPDMCTEDMPIKILDVLRIVAQLTKVVNNKLFQVANF